LHILQGNIHCRIASYQAVPGVQCEKSDHPGGTRPEELPHKARSVDDNPDGVAGCVSYYSPLNRSDQPQPKIELKLKGKGEDHG